MERPRTPDCDLHLATGSVTVFRGLVRACHPLPTVAVTTCVSLLGWRLGWQGAQLALLIAAVLTGQLSVGWSNDAHDAATDRKLDRVEKPAVDGSVSVPALWTFALGAALACIPLTVLAAGWIAGAFHLIGVLMAWIYNLRLSRTRWSWLPYLVAFGCLPYFLCLGAPNAAMPALWFVVAAAGLGVGAHLANAGADRQRDSAGTAVSLGSPGTILVALAALLIAGLAVIIGVSTVSGEFSIIGGIGVLTLLSATGVQCWRARWKAGFRLVMGLAGWCVLLLLLTPAQAMIQLPEPSQARAATSSATVTSLNNRTSASSSWA